jgi:hypothetical protein
VPWRSRLHISPVYQTVRRCIPEYRNLIPVALSHWTADTLPTVLATVTQKSRSVSVLTLVHPLNSGTTALARLRQVFGAPADEVTCLKSSVYIHLLPCDRVHSMCLLTERLLNMRSLVIWVVSVSDCNFVTEWVHFTIKMFVAYCSNCATNRKVAGSIPDEVTGIFQWLNPSGRIVALGSTQPLTEKSTRNHSWG